MKKLTIIAIMLAAVALSSCSNAQRTTEFLESQGYTNIRTAGFDLFAHGKEDWTTTGFEAVAPSGKRVKGAVSDKGPFAFFQPRMVIRVWGEVK